MYVYAGCMLTYSHKYTCQLGFGLLQTRILFSFLVGVRLKERVQIRAFRDYLYLDDDHLYIDDDVYRDHLHLDDDHVYLEDLYLDHHLHLDDDHVYLDDHLYRVAGNVPVPSHQYARRCVTLSASHTGTGPRLQRGS